MYYVYKSGVATNRFIALRFVSGIAAVSVAQWCGGVVG